MINKKGRYIMEYKNAKPKKLLSIILIIILVIVAFLSCLISIKPFGVYIPQARFGVYSTVEGVDNIVPAGSVIITDRFLEYNPNIIVAAFIENEDANYPACTKSAFVGRLVYENNSYFIKNGNKKSMPVSEHQIEPVVYYIDNIGTIQLYLHNYRFVLWGAWAAVFTVIIVLFATASSRRAKKNINSLKRVFDFYGEKFDNEEKNRNY